MNLRKKPGSKSSLGIGKKGEETAINSLSRIVVWTLVFFFSMLVYINSFANSGMIAKEMYAVDTGLNLEAIQAARGDLIYKQEIPYDLALKDNTIFLSEKGINQNNKYEFTREKSSIFMPSQTIAGQVSFLKSGSEISISQKEPANHAGEGTQLTNQKKLACQKTSLTYDFPNTNITLDPGHGGTDFGYKSGNNEEARITFNIANMLKTKYSSMTNLDITKESSQEFTDISERRRIAKDSDILVSIHVGSLNNKGKITIYTPQDARSKESAILGCIISNQFHQKYIIGYPIESLALNEYEILNEGLDASVYIEVGSIEDSFNIVSIADSIYAGMLEYAAMQ